MSKKNLNPKLHYSHKKIKIENEEWVGIICFSVLIVFTQNFAVSSVVSFFAILLFLLLKFLKQ